MANVNWSEEATRNLDQIVSHIKQFHPPAAARLGAKLYALGQSLRHFPNRGRPAAGDTRELVTVPPYVLTYGVQDDVVVILSIRHGARLPRND